jgi:hypothetical protein
VLEQAFDEAYSSKAGQPAVWASGVRLDALTSTTMKA